MDWKGTVPFKKDYRLFSKAKLFNQTGKHLVDHDQSAYLVRTGLGRFAQRICNVLQHLEMPLKTMLCIPEVISKSTELCYLLLPVYSVSIPSELGCISGGDSNTFL